jgi:hypothetical protein
MHEGSLTAIKHDKFVRKHWYTASGFASNGRLLVSVLQTEVSAKNGSNAA